MSPRYLLSRSRHGSHSTHVIGALKTPTMAYYKVRLWNLWLLILNKILVKSYLSLYPIPLKFCTKHDSDNVGLCAKFQNDWTTETDVMIKRDFVRFIFKLIFRRISYIAQPLGAPDFGKPYLERFLSHLWTFENEFLFIPFLYILWLFNQL